MIEYAAQISTLTDAERQGFLLACSLMRAEGQRMMNCAAHMPDMQSDELHRAGRAARLVADLAEGLAEKDLAAA